MAQIVENRRRHVSELLELHGDFPQCNTKIAVAQDWIHVLMERMASICEQARFDESDPEVNKPLRTALADLIATCEEWDKRLTLP